MSRYTNIVLTVIAIALSVIALENLVGLPRVFAQSNEPVRVQICGYAGGTSQFGCANLGAYLNPVSGNRGLALYVNSPGLIQ